MITLRSASSTNTRTDVDLLLRKVPRAYALYKQFVRQHEPGEQPPAASSTLIGQASI